MRLSLSLSLSLLDRLHVYSAMYIYGFIDMKLLTYVERADHTSSSGSLTACMPHILLSSDPCMHMALIIEAIESSRR
jgi:hypothetical protein